MGSFFTVRTLVGIVLGGAGGFALYKFVGCKTGDCPITANPWLSILFGVIIGLALTAHK